ncbi:hypothetical protein MPSEU_000322400 [Mayamaea pseudoterrestris]|nr:hypothetical protein MPSEU_000322400 [Mayamaea pseudoterrestris]
MSANTYRPVALRMYRILLKQSRILRQTAAFDDDCASSILLQTPLDKRGIGTSQHFNLREPSNEKDARESLYRFFASYANDDDDDDDLKLHEWLEELLDGWYYTLGIPPPRSHWTSLDCLFSAIKFAFRHGPPVHDNDKQRDDYALYTKWSLRLFKLLQRQAALRQTSSVSTNHNVRVIATSQFMGVRALQPLQHRSGFVFQRSKSSDDESDSDDDDEDFVAPKFLFGYRIRIENLSSSDSVQLLGRSWHIQETSSSNQPLGDAVRVHAPTTGAVGKLPVLHPSQVFEYSSQCELVTPHGDMKGCFHFCGKVPPTTLSSNVGVHVDAFDRPLDAFTVDVQPFRLLADDGTSGAK